MKNLINKIINVCLMLCNIALGIGLSSFVAAFFYFALPSNYQMIAAAIFIFLFTISFYAILIISLVSGPLLFMLEIFDDETPKAQQTKENDSKEELGNMKGDKEKHQGKE